MDERLHVSVIVCKQNSSPDAACRRNSWIPVERTHRVGHWRSTEKKLVWVSLWHYIPPMVGSWNSKNSSLTNRTTRHDFPTAVSPRRTSLKWCTRLDMVVIGRVGYFLCENFGVVLVVGVVCIVFRVCQTKKIATEVQRITAGIPAENAHVMTARPFVRMNRRSILSNCASDKTCRWG